MIEYRKMSLFDAPKGSLLVHACNCHGVWGGGIALEFAKRYPGAFKSYQAVCEMAERMSKEGWKNNLPGKGIWIPDGNEESEGWIGCLFTSEGFGNTKDSTKEILFHTTLAVYDLLKCYHELHFQGETIYSNKFNSGLFGVPWEETEYILEKLTDDVNWVVCDPGAR